ncbi:MAG: hypothetical protein JRI23_17825 [Deltaproteobacteria bacterium]|jgi:hypothetical protein|nr:hypothetical protein [Deltaproteobacteria bacterium]MBW2533690.1 hypothetical protein [Deltaproteobacteria bacterium]
MGSADLQRDVDSDRHDDPLASLADLPAHDIHPVRAAYLRQQARAAFEHEHGRARGRWTAIAELYGRVLEPAWVAALCLSYLGWALLQAASLHG